MAVLTPAEQKAVDSMRESLKNCPLGFAHYPHSTTDYDTDLVWALRATGWCAPPSEENAS